MIFYVLDTNVIIPNYFPRPEPKNPQNVTDQENYDIKRYDRIVNGFAYLVSQWIKKEATLIVPNFVIAEVLNHFAYHQFRNFPNKSESQKKNDYINLKDKFIGRVRYSASPFKKRKKKEKWFFNYELNRHHILNLDRVLPIEHTTEPLYKDPNIAKGKVELSPFDLLLIAVALELEILTGKGAVFLATTERRLTSVCMNKDLPKCYKIDAIKEPKKQLPQIEEKQKIIVPKPTLVA